MTVSTYLSIREMISNVATFRLALTGLIQNPLHNRAHIRELETRCSASCASRGMKEIDVAASAKGAQLKGRIRGNVTDSECCVEISAA